ncbi:MAG: hypothetical protein MR582_08095 [Campylobacter sp.]|nr:hypothetical protein [Campylobacter sp.]
MNSFLVFKNLYSKEKCEMQFNELDLRSFLNSNNLFYINDICSNRDYLKDLIKELSGLRRKHPFCAIKQVVIACEADKSTPYEYFGESLECISDILDDETEILFGLDYSQNLLYKKEILVGLLVAISAC